MKSMLSIVKKELRTYFNSPIAYIALVFFLLFTSVWFFFFQQFFVQGNASLQSFFAIMPAVFVILVPAITMRSWAEERKLGTIELLATLPFSEWTLVLGKYLAAFLLLCVMVLLTLPIPLLMSLFGRFDAGEIAGEYLSVMFMGSASVAIGTFVSSTTKNQISAFIMAVLVLLALSFGAQLSVLVGFFDFLRPVLRWICLNEHYENFSKGVVDTRDLAYFIIMTAAFLYLTVKNLVFRKWR
jgi:ABC-2 type transport system permease protein